MKSKLEIDINGNKSWKLPNGDLHRENGPAFEATNGYKSWYKNGKLHRENGPGIIYYDNSKEWWLNGKQYTEEEYKYEMRLIKLKHILDWDETKIRNR